MLPESWPAVLLGTMSGLIVVPVAIDAAGQGIRAVECARFGLKWILDDRIIHHTAQYRYSGPRGVRSSGISTPHGMVILWGMHLDSSKKVGRGRCLDYAKSVFSCDR